MNDIKEITNNDFTSLSLFKKEEAIAKFKEVLGKKANSFLTSVMSIISQSDMLKDADPKSVYLAAITSATLDLPINPNLGFAYILPYNTKNGVVAQFQMGYKGFIQLALRSGQFKTISASPVYEGQLVEENPLTGYKFDWSVKPKGNPIGYASYFSLINGFEKTFYMPIEDMKTHGMKFSQTFKKGFGVRKDDFDSMALKTVLKLSLSKRAPLSVDMQKAVMADQGVIEDENLDGIDYIDNDQDAIADIDIEEKMKEVTPLSDKNDKKWQTTT